MSYVPLTSEECVDSHEENLDAATQIATSVAHHQVDFCYSLKSAKLVANEINRENKSAVWFVVRDKYNEIDYIPFAPCQYYFRDNSGKIVVMEPHCFQVDEIPENVGCTMRIRNQIITVKEIAQKPTNLNFSVPEYWEQC